MFLHKDVFLHESMAVVSRDGLHEESLKQTKNSTLYGTDPSDIENNILFEIKQPKKAKKRANTQSVIDRVSGRLGLSDEGIASKLNELVQSGKIIASTNRGKETFKLRDERDDADSHIAYDFDLTKSDDESYLWEGQDTAFNGKHFGCEMNNQSITQPTRPSHKAAMVTLPISIVSDLTKNSNMVNEMLKRERQLVYDLMKENTELKLKIKDLEAGPFNLHGQMTSEPPKSRKPPERSNNKNSVLPLHNRYSILSDSALNETKRDTSSHNKSNSEDNSLELCSNPGKQHQAERRKTDKAQLTKKNQDKPNNERSSSVLIIGDSIPKHIDGLKMHKSLKRKHKITVKAFGGSTIKNMEHYSKPPLEKNPELVILHIGTNDIKSDKSPSEIASNIHKLAKEMEQGKRKVAISALIPRNDSEDLTKKSNMVNIELRKLCEGNGTDLIEHTALTTRHLNGSNLHLNRFGTSIFARDFIQYIRE